MDSDRTELLRDAADRSARFLDDLQERVVRPAQDDVARLQKLMGALPEGPTDPAAVLAMLDEIGSPAAQGNAGPRFFGWVIGGAMPVTVGANWLATAWDQNVGLWAVSPTGSAIEESALAWLLDVLDLPRESAGAFTTGATMANFTGLAAARHALLQRAGWDVEADGLFGAPPITVVVGGEAHPSVTKALGLLGFGRSRVISVPVDDQGRIVAKELPKIDGEVLVCAQAGNVNTGASDPLREICEWAHDGGGWVHVDGAFGLWAAAAPARRQVIDGYEHADSWATDAHKWLNVPYDSGVAFVRDSSALRASMAVAATYLPEGEHREPMHYTPELSRRARGVEVWAALKALGRSGVAEMIDRCCRHATRFAEGLRAGGYEVLNDVVLNQVLVSFGSDEETARTIAAIQDDGTCFCAGTVWQGRSAMRISVSSWATTEDDVERSLEAMLRCAASARAAVASA
jgi:glutamate/tyrosine decarboxylase-like PLP-dependent enzyme